jgi:hypothetical protein
VNVAGLLRSEVNQASQYKTKNKSENNNIMHFRHVLKQGCEGSLLEGRYGKSLWELIG